ncbi:MAG: type I-U CRISPR-associated RAMP protein Csb1/Cas7u [Solirubrobacteraceae bacterium]|nr:type I-U CRISPR-associated RAMP protein Csb1/Cas7u [Solirubrobacteraceae bacterium]
MQLEELGNHLRRGGAAILNHPATYAVANGAVIPPARYAGANGSEFVFETRCIDGAFTTTALVDSKQSQSNRSEVGLVEARGEDGPASLIPMLSVAYPTVRLLDAQLPHRAFDAHIRASSHADQPVVETAWYRALRDATHVDLSPLFTTSPVTLAFGGWDSSRKRGQLRLRSLYVSELFGVVSDGDGRVSRRSGGRLDPLGQDFHVSPDEFSTLLDRQRAHMSETTVAKLEAALAKARKAKAGSDTLSAAALGLGGVPPSPEAAYGVAVPEVQRARTYSLAGLRRLRFGGSAGEDVAARTALLAILLLGAAYADADPEIRAYCDVAAPQGRVLLDDEMVELDLSIESTGAFLRHAIDQLPERLAWTGQVIELIGDPALDRGAVSDDAEA